MQLREPRDVIFCGHAGQLLVQRLQHGAIEQGFGGEHLRGLRMQRGDRDHDHDRGDGRELVPHRASILTHGSDLIGTARLKPDTAYTPDPFGPAEAGHDVHAGLIRSG